MRQHRNLFVFMLIMILGVALLTGCGTLGAGSAGDDDSGDGGTGDGGSGAGSSNEDESSGDEEDDAFDEIDLSVGCPEELAVYNLYLDFQLNVEEDDGYIHERTDPSASVSVQISGSNVLYFGDLETIPVTIEGASGDCTITGNAEISLSVSGYCELGVATLDIRGTYQSYQRSIICPGAPTVHSSDSLFAGPSITADFNLVSSPNGDTVENSWETEGMQFIYAWILKPGGGAPQDN
jgi:hypothetical protein